MDERERRTAAENAAKSMRDRSAKARERHPFLRCSFECADGWSGPVEAMLAELAPVVAGTDFAIVQVKEKFGGLRVYWQGDVDAAAVRAIIGRAEEAAARTCEVSGQAGRLVNNGGWYRVLAPEHMEPGAKPVRGEAVRTVGGRATG